MEWNWHRDHLELMKNVIDQWAYAFLVTASILGLSILGGRLWATHRPEAVKKYAPWMQLIGGALILWTVYGVMGHEMASWKGETALEKMDKWVFNLLNGAGMLLIFLSSSALIFKKE